MNQKTCRVGVTLQSVVRLPGLRRVLVLGMTMHSGTALRAPGRSLVIMVLRTRYAYLAQIAGRQSYVTAWPRCRRRLQGATLRVAFMFGW